MGADASKSDKRALNIDLFEFSSFSIPLLGGFQSLSGQAFAHARTRARQHAHHLHLHALTRFHALPHARTWTHLGRQGCTHIHIHMRIDQTPMVFLLCKD